MYYDKGNGNNNLKNEEDIRLSYESDGIMGKEDSTLDKDDRKVKPKDFFNTTQSSE
jgi:hypothetical protein